MVRRHVGAVRRLDVVARRVVLGRMLVLVRMLVQVLMLLLGAIVRRACLHGRLAVRAPHRRLVQRLRTTQAEARQSAPELARDAGLRSRRTGMKGGERWLAAGRSDEIGQMRNL